MHALIIGMVCENSKLRQLNSARSIVDCSQAEATIELVNVGSEACLEQGEKFFIVY